VVAKDLVPAKASGTNGERPIQSADGAISREFHAAARSSLSSPRITILSAASGNGRWSAFASSHGARIQTSCSSAVVRIAGIAFGWIGFTTAFASVVKKP
jgi:hypothetical protein